ncbi:2-dehydropantoate 2-reductase [Ruminiclostridium herbifermentans]|uniref:2-dehydropantoate 2-reductase n=1 Tax=Ruminiclostridium herbifermentans TaxID=2488810 RepID=A0A4U7JJL2_9FIRM|nr:2-dehydropantoate 2-reductase [Ruminiclostridium herbifermentans]QNU66257.1 2-dehydropantoate 2-reductase [Ruminiclostridium herbifermentans]
MSEIRKIINICIYGVGGVGGYFGGKLCQSMSASTHFIKDKDFRVYFVARGEHYKEIYSNGLTMHTEEQGEIIIKPYAVVNDASLIPPADIYIICTKSYDLCGAIESIKDKITNDTVILPLLNGIDIYERIRQVCDKGIVFPACVYIASYIDKPGVIKQTGPNGRIVFGRDPQNYSYIPYDLFKLFERAGIQFQWVDNPYPLIYEKYILICSFALVTAKFGVTMGRVIEDSYLLNILKNIMREIKSIADKKGINMSDNIIDDCIELVRKYPADTKTSYQRDIEQMKEHNEGELYANTIITLGESLNIDTPYTKLVANIE